MAVALLVVPWARSGEPVDGAGADLSALTLGLIEAAIGSLMTVQPGAFAPGPYAALQGAVPLVGFCGLAGAAALLYLGTGGWRAAAHSWGRRLAAAVLPLLMVYNWAQAGAWTGVLDWGIWLVMLFLPDVIRPPVTHRCPPASQTGRGTWTRIPAWSNCWRSQPGS